MIQLSTEDRVQLLKHCKFLAAAPAEMLNFLANRGTTEVVARDSAVFNAGETGHTMYVIASGRVRVHQGDVTMAELGAGELFGEMTVLDEQARSATVTATEDCALLAIARDGLFEALKHYPESFEGIMHAVLQRERTIVEDVRRRTERLMGYQKELEIGRKIQADFLPVSIPEVEHWEVAPFFEAAREVAGDFYDVFLLPESGQLALVIGDVCDKGVGAALYMSLFRSLIRSTALRDSANEMPGHEAARILENAITTTNRYIAVTHPRSSMFASVFFGLLDPVSGALQYINAGHESPVIYRADGTRDVLEVTGGVLGLFAMAPYGVASAQMGQGDLLYAYTDGVNEAKNSEGAQFSDARILEMDTPWPGSAQAFVDEIYRRIRAFRVDAEPSDDITMLTVRRQPEGVQGG